MKPSELYHRFPFLDPNSPEWSGLRNSPPGLEKARGKVVERYRTVISEEAAWMTNLDTDFYCVESNWDHTWQVVGNYGCPCVSLPNQVLACLFPSLVEMRRNNPRRFRVAMEALFCCLAEVILLRKQASALRRNIRTGRKARGFVSNDVLFSGLETGFGIVEARASLAIERMDQAGEQALDCGPVECVSVRKNSLDFSLDIDYPRAC